jgi:hypothetical protein
MAWNSDPKIRELVDYAKRHQFAAIVNICIRNDGRFEVLSVGDDAKNCAKTKAVGDEVFRMMCDGEIDFPSYQIKV